MVNLTLNQRLVLAVLAALIPIAIMSVYQAVSNREYTRQLIADRLAVNALAEASKQREPIISAQRMLATLVQNPNVYDSDPNCVEIFKENLAVQKALVNITWSDAAGNVTCSVIPMARPQSNAGKSWWRKGVASKKFTLSGPLVGDISKTRIIVAMQPLFTTSGTFVGAVSTGIKLSWIEQSLQEKRLSTESIVGIADGDGKMLMSAGRHGIDRINIGKSFGTAASIRGENGAEWLYSSAPLYEDQLHIVYAEPARRLALPLREQLRAGIIWPVIAILLTLFAVWAGVNKMVLRWLKELGATTRQYASGDYADRPGQYSGAPPEIAEVSTNLLSMSRAIQQRNEELEESVSVTQKMSREVHHRVKNNLQMIMSLLALQSAQVKDVEARRVLDQTRVRMAAFSLIHRLLYEKRDDADQGTVEMDRLFRELCIQLHSSLAAQSRIKLNCHSTVGRRPVDEAIPLALLAVEAVTNAFRHAFPDDKAGEVAVSLTLAGENICLVISDSGVGYDAIDRIDMMGMDLIRAFVDQLEGRMEIVAAPDKGVILTVTYPMSRNVETGHP